MSQGEAEPPAGGVIRLRSMTAIDIAEGVRLLAQLGYAMAEDELAQRLRDVLSAPGHEVLIAVSGAQIAGLMHVFVRPAIENPREAVVQAIVVDAAHRRAGIGRSLMAAAERFGTEQQCRSVVLSSNITRAPAHAFYKALGYQVAATSYIFRKPLAL
jgi:ribosomal protein S18 acetylase RimI-like enzyme